MQPSTSEIDPTLSPPAPLDGGRGEFWCLDPDRVFLNHGSFGARARVVARKQADLREELERDPYVSIWERSADDLATARGAVAEFVGAAAEDLVPVVNASEAVNSVVRSFDLRPGQNLVATGHGYNAVNQTLRYQAERSGASLRLVDLHPPLPDEAGIARDILAAVDGDTALVMIDHISSPTAMLFPVEEIVAGCRRRGVPVMVDGAHAPGMLELQLSEIGADFYTGNLHKWVSAPVGAAFLQVSPAFQDRIHPTVISHYLGEGFQREFEWLGTRDISAFLTAPTAISWFQETFGWGEVRRHNRSLIAWATQLVCRAWNVRPLDVPARSAVVSMRTIELPPEVRKRFDDVEDWRAWLRRVHGLDVAVHDWAGRWWVRLSAHVYNRPEDYEHLVSVGLAFD